MKNCFREGSREPDNRRKISTDANCSCLELSKFTSIFYQTESHPATRTIVDGATAFSEGEPVSHEKGRCPETSGKGKVFDRWIQRYLDMKTPFVKTPLIGKEMKSHTEYLTFNLPTRMGFLNITPTIEEIVRKSGISEGLLLCNAMHRSDTPVLPG